MDKRQADADAKAAKARFPNVGGTPNHPKSAKNQFCLLLARIFVGDHPFQKPPYIFMYVYVHGTYVYIYICVFSIYIYYYIGTFINEQCSNL